MFKAANRCAMALAVAWPCAAALAADAPFSLNGVHLVLQDVTDQVSVQYRSMRLNRAGGVWNAEVVLTNLGQEQLEPPLLLVVESFSGTSGPLAVDGQSATVPAHPYYDLSWHMEDGRLVAGASTSPRTLTLGVSSGAPSLSAKVYARRVDSTWALTSLRTLTEAGQPLTDVAVTQTGPAGTDTFQSDAETALVTLGAEAGTYAWQFDQAGFLPAWRQADLVAGELAFPASPWLAPRSTDSRALTPFDGGQLVSADQAVALSYGAGSVQGEAAATLTPLTAQTLPALLPQGWSPLQAFWLELSEEPRQAATASLKPWGTIGAGESAALVRWNPATLHWDVQGVVQGRGAEPVQVALAGRGAFALVVGDAAPSAPPPAEVGRPLEASSASAPSAEALVAAGSVTPPASLASLDPRLVTAKATVVITNTTGALPSGLVLHTRVEDAYELSDGSRRHPSPYEQTLIAYQRPGDTDPATLHTRFPMRPLFLFSSERLKSATVKIDVLSATTFSGTILDAKGGAVIVGNIRLLAGAGVFEHPQTVLLRSLTVSDFDELIGEEGEVVQAFELTTAGPVAAPPLSLDIRGLEPGLHYVLARVLARGGWYGLEPRERLNTDARAVLSSAEPESLDRLPGLTQAGQYLLIRVDAPLGLISGIARNADGDPIGDLPARISERPWLTFSQDSSGTFQLVAAAGETQVEIVDPTSGDTGRTSVAISDPGVPVPVSLSTVAEGPRVIAVSPAPGATGVSQASPVSVEFSRSINPGSIGTDGIRLLDSNGMPVKASVSLNLGNTAVTLLSDTPLSAGVLHTLQLAASLSDLTGRPLEGETTFTFTTVQAASRNTSAQLTSYEPDAEGLAALVADPGLAEPEAPVILVNETTGFTATVLSKVDGSFSNSIPADVDDLLSAVIVNANGTRNVVPVSRQLFQDGSVGLFSGGGVIQAESPYGAIELIVDAGSIPNKTRFRIEAVEVHDVLATVSNTPPEMGMVLNGLRYSQQGDELLHSPHLAIPIDVAALGLPEGANPTNATYALTVPREVDGQYVYEIIDHMEYEDGKLVTHSLPFTALLGIMRFAQTSTMGTVIAAPCLMAMGYHMVVAGSTVKGTVIDTGGGSEVLRLGRVGGAVVTAQPGEAGSQWIGNAGQLRRGAFITTSHPTTGFFTFLIAAETYSEQGGAVAFLARHPAYFGIAAQRGVTLPTTEVERVAVGNIMTPVDLVFPADYNARTTDLSGPQIELSHQPFFPAPGSDAVLTVLCSDDATLPSVRVTLDSAVSLVEGVPVYDDEILLAQLSSDPVSTRIVRESYTVRCEKAARVLLKIEAVDGVGHRAVALHAIEFGGTDSPEPGPLVASDPLDEIPPYVLMCTPPPGSGGLVPGRPIKVLFSEAVEDWSVRNPSAVFISPAAHSPQISLSADQREMTLLYPDLLPNTDYTLTFTSSILDLNGNRLDQDPETDAADSFVATYQTTPLPTGRMNGIEYGGGAVYKGVYAYVLERLSPLNGAVVVYDLSDPQAPAEVAKFSVPGYPRDLVLIPQYSFKRRPGGPTQTSDLLAVVGGRIGYENVPGQYLWVLDITDPHQPRRLASSIIVYGPAAAVTRVRWDAPMLGYLEMGEVASIGLVNLQSFILGKNMTPDDILAYPPHPGFDGNGDGDFIDDGDQLPIPVVYGSPDYVGKVHAVTLGGTTEMTDQIIRDFDLELGGMCIGVVVEPGYTLDRTTPFPAAYRTLFNGTMDLPRSLASLNISDAVPTRLKLLFGLPLTVDNQLQLLDVALVSVKGIGSTDANALWVIDITDRLAPKHISTIHIPAAAGSTPLSVIRREDGVLVLTTRSSLLLLDPLRLAEPTAGSPGTFHPAILDIIPTGGVGTYTYQVGVCGLVTMSQGGNNRVLQMAPSLQFVEATEEVPFSPSTWTSLSEVELSEKMSKFSPVTSLRLSRFRAEPGMIESSLVPPSPLTHYYVRVDAPGSAGAFIDLALESLDLSGRALKPKGLLFPAVHAVSTQTSEDLGYAPVDGERPGRACRAFRLSGNPTSPFYNVYLSRPFALVYEEMTAEETASLQTVLERDILWSGRFLRVSLDPAMAPGILEKYAGRVLAGQKILQPGVQAMASSFPADYLHGPNPMPLVNAAMIPMTLGSVGSYNAGLHYSTVDLSLPGRRLPLEFRRTCNAQGLYDGPFGRGWDFNFNQRLVECRPDVFPEGYRWPIVVRQDEADSEVAEAGDVLYINGAGRVVVYRDAGDSLPSALADDDLVLTQLDWDSRAIRYYLPPPGVFDVLLKFSDGQFARLEPDGTQTWFDSLGRLTKVYDRYDKNSLVLKYNRQGQLVRILDELRRPIRIGYWRSSLGDPDSTNLDKLAPNPRIVGKICCLEDYSGRAVMYYYTSDGLLDGREGPRVSRSVLGGFLGDPKIRYVYSSAADPTRTARSLIGVIHGDSIGSPLISVTALGSRGRDVVDEVQIGGRKTSIALGFPNTAAALSAGNQQCVVTGPDLATTEYTLDRFGHPKRVTLAGYAAPACTTTTDYYPNGLVKTITYPEGNSVTYRYENAANRLRSQSNIVQVDKNPGLRGGEALFATATFDPYYNLRAGTIRDFAGHEAIVALTPDKRDTQTITMAGHSEHFRPNVYGQMERHETIDGIVRTWAYTSDGFIQSQAVGEGAQALTMTFSYDAPGGDRGLPSTAVDSAGRTTFFTYNERNQLIQKSREGAVAQFAYDEFNNLSAIGFTVDDDRTLIERRTYNAVGFLLSKTIQGVEIDDHVGDLTTVFVPDDMNRVQAVKFPGDDVHTLLYDHGGQVIEYAVGDEYREHYGYDRNGNRTAVTIGDGTEHFVYDGHDRLIEIITPEGTRVAFSYDGNGKILSKQVRDEDGAVLYSAAYSTDQFGRYRTVNVARDSGTVETRYDYNAMERSVSMTDALGATAKTYYDEVGRVQLYESPSRSESYTYTTDGRVASRTTVENGRSFTTQYGYNTRGHLQSITDNADLTVSYDLGIDGRIRGVTDPKNHAVAHDLSVLGELLSTLPEEGAAIHFTYNRNRDLSSSSDPDDHKTTHAFDGNGRLRQVTLPNGETITYSAFNALGLAEQIDMPRDIQVQLSYDAEGHVTTRKVGSRTEQYTYDGLGRLTELTDLSGSLSLSYDSLGFTKEFRFSYTAIGLAFSVLQDADNGGFRKWIEYPAGGVRVQNGRDQSGRLLSLEPSGTEVVVKETRYATDTLVGARVFGDGVVGLNMNYDAIKRLSRKQYVRLADDAVLVDVRYSYASDGLVEARQFLERAGRADFFHYDKGHRLIRADLGVRPSLGLADSPRVLPGFAIPSEVSGNWKAGYFGRDFIYSSADVLAQCVAVNPDGFDLPPLATDYGAPDALLYVGSIDGFARERDAVGNVIRARLWVRVPGGSRPQPVSGLLYYNELGQLTRVEREDGVEVSFSYGANGLRIRRSVTGDRSRCEPSDVAYVYDGGNMIEERDLLQGGMLRARYYYGDDGDELIAGDVVTQPSGPLERYYFLSDGLRSVVAIADSTGSLVERAAYDAWGQPTFQLPDLAPPEVSSITTGPNSFKVAFSETVLPSFADVPADEGLYGSLRPIDEVFEVRSNGALVSGQLQYIETEVGAAFGSVFVFHPADAFTGEVELTIAPGGLQDEWNLPNPRQTFAFNPLQPPGTVVYSGVAPGSTAPQSAGHSSMRSPFGFQGHIFDEDTGLLYCRGRYYDPSVGMFLQRDPAGYADGVNQYAGFANNPSTLRDATGLATDELGRELSEKGRQNAEKEGIGNKLAGLAMMAAGEVLQLGTGAAEGVDLLQNHRSGTFGLMDLKNGAALIAWDAFIAVDTGTLGFAAAHMAVNGALRAGTRMHGFMNRARQFPGMTERTATFLEAKGVRRLEVESVAYSMERHNASIMIRQFREPAARLAAARSGQWKTKPWFAKRKTGQGVAHHFESDYLEGLGLSSRAPAQHTYVSDLDILDIHIGGARATSAEARQVIHTANQRFAQLWKASGRQGAPPVPFRHGTHLGAVDDFGAVLDTRGKMLRIDNDYLASMGHPGDAITLRIGGKGNLLAYETPSWQVSELISNLEQPLMQKQAMLGEPVIGFPKSWKGARQPETWAIELSPEGASLSELDPFDLIYW